MAAKTSDLAFAAALYSLGHPLVQELEALPDGVYRFCFEMEEETLEKDYALYLKNQITVDALRFGEGMRLLKKLIHQARFPEARRATSPSR